MYILKEENEGIRICPQRAYDNRFLNGIILVATIGRAYFISSDVDNIRITDDP